MKKHIIVGFLFGIRLIPFSYLFREYGDFLLLVVKLPISIYDASINKWQILWLLIGTFSGIAFFGIQLITVIVEYGLSSISSLDIVHTQTIWLFVTNFAKSLGNESIDEEYLFRGFIWGYLKQLGIK